MNKMNNVVAISKGRVAADIVAEARRRSAQSARANQMRVEVLALERELARLADAATREDRPARHIHTAWTLPLIALTGVAVWAAGSDGDRYEDPTTAVALAVSLAFAIAAGTRWRSAPYPRVGFPAFLIAPVTLLALGGMTIAAVVGDVAALSWIVVAGALAHVRLRASWSAFDQRRRALRHHALTVEVAVLKAALADLVAGEE